MPKVKNPLFSQEARGGVAGLVYNTWRGINTVKTNTSPTGQGTVKRLAAQAKISAVSKLWATLTDVQRAAWSQYATDHPVTDWTGSPKRLTGMNWFVMCNINLELVGSANVLNAPTIAAPDPTTGFAMASATHNLQCTWTTPTAATAYIVLFVAGPLSAGRTAKLENAKLSGAFAASTTPPHIIAATPAVGRYTGFAKVIDTTTGLASTWQSSLIDVTAGA